MADVKKWKSAVLSSGKPNRKKYKVLVEGIKLKSFRDNPVMLYVHKTATDKGEEKTLRFPIGRWDNIRVENGKLIADPVFDLKDEMGREVARRWEEGFLNATSIRHTFDDISADDIHILQEDIDFVVLSCEVLEASIVDIPGDGDALVITSALSCEISESGACTCSDTPLSILPLLTKKESLNPNTEMDKKVLCLSLGLAETATDEQITQAINALKATKVDGVLNLGRQKGVVTDANLTAMRTMVEQNPDFAKLSWEQLPDPKTETIPNPQPSTPVMQESLSAALRNIQHQNPPVVVQDDRKAWTLRDWRMKDPDGLLALETANPIEFTRIVKMGIGTGMAVADAGMRFV